MVADVFFSDLRARSEAENKGARVQHDAGTPGVRTGYRGGWPYGAGRLK
ncbi:MAG: hypothetical protein LUQ42_03545 [Methanomicrobiales archaeon]|nr:hypothetical protein [Methanomicrobiales archaeon]